MKTKTVPFVLCDCGKRGFTSERDAEKALGRAQTKRNRAAAGVGTLRGIVRESRWYECDVSELLHLTGQSKRVYNSYAEPAEHGTNMTWEQYLAGQGAKPVRHLAAVA